MKSIIIFFVPFYLLAEGTNLFVKKDDTKLLKKPSLASHKINVLKKDTKLKLIESQGMFHKVKVNGLEGWIHKLHVTKLPSNTDFGELSKDTGESAKKRASNQAEIAGSRGLDSEEDKDEGNCKKEKKQTKK